MSTPSTSINRLPAANKSTEHGITMRTSCATKMLKIQRRYIVTNAVTLKWTNQNQFEDHIATLWEKYGNNIPPEDALDFRFEFNDGLFSVGKDID